MIIMLLCSCVSAARTTWKQAKKTYHSMVEYYTRDVENNLRNISDYLLRISETADYYGMTNCEEDKESMNNLSRQRLYNQLNEDILVYSSADYFFIFQDKYADIMMVESAKKKAKIQSQNIREQLKRLLESREPTEKWELFDAEGYQYLIRVVSKDGVVIGCAVSVNRLIETMQAVQLSDYYVSYYKIGTMILDNESGKDLKIELPIQETDVGVRIVIPSEKLFEEIRTLLNFSMVFAAILIILLFALYISMYHWFTNPVKRIVSVMQKVDEEGIDLKMPEFDNWEEYHIVSKNFNNMMEKIKILKIDVYEKEKKQSELYKQYLMLQINPHFILNALNTIYMLNKRKDNNQVNILLTYLINYFKSVFARQGEMVPLKEEINFMLNYMAIQKFRFGSGEAKGQILESVRGTDLYLLVDVLNYSMTYSLCGNENHMSPDDHYQDLKRIIAAVGGKARRITVIMPFLYESRQHKRTSRESLDCALALQELVSMGVDNIITFDAHDPRVQNAIPLHGFETVQPAYQFIKGLLRNVKDLQLDSSHMMVISPDEGGMGRAIYIANVLGLDMGMFYKRRDYTRIVNGRNPIVAHEFLGTSVEGKDMIIIDDMISSGESMLEVAAALKERKANKIFVFSTFGLFTNGLDKFDNAYENGIIDKVLTTNLIYQTPELLQREWYINCDMSKYIAYIIDTLNHDSSISDLLNPNERIQNIVAKYKTGEL